MYISTGNDALYQPDRILRNARLVQGVINYVPDGLPANGWFRAPPGTVIEVPNGPVPEGWALREPIEGPEVPDKDRHFIPPIHWYTGERDERLPVVPGA